MEIADLKVGDVAYVLSGRQNSFFPVEITDRDDTGVQVYVEAKREHQWYFNNGRADATADEGEDGPPRAMLVTTDDWRIKVLRQRKLFKEHHKRVQDATNEFRKDPTPENATALFQTVMSWRDFAHNADPSAIRAESIQEYLDLTNSQ